MATTAHIIRSNYDPEVDKDRLLIETGQESEIADTADIWEKENLPKSKYRPPPPQFVPATTSYDEWGNIITGVSNEPAPSRSGPPANLASWYRSLQRAELPPSSATTPPSAPAPAASSPSSSSNVSSASTPIPGDRRDEFTKPNWFSLSSTPPIPAPSTTLADILAREPPSSHAPHVPPVFLHLQPDNRGWTMLQSQGWSEGEALGSSRWRPTKSEDSSSVARPDVLKKLRALGAAVVVKHEEVPCGPDPEVVEVRRTPVIDLTLSSDEEDEHESAEADSESGAQMEKSRSFSEAATSDAVDRRATQKALLTPLPTILKADRLGIGLKAKTAGPHRQSVKRVTHNAAALAAHIRAGEETRRKKEVAGRGRRAFARLDRAESQARRDLQAYMNS